MIAIILGFASMMLTRPPDILIADVGRFLAARATDGHYFVSADKGEKIVRSFFTSETGEALAPWPAANSGVEGGLVCAGELCRYTARGRQVAIVTGTAALPIKCSGVDAIVSQVPAGFLCRSIVPVIDRIDFGGSERSRCGSTRIASRLKAPTKAAAIAPGSRTRALPASGSR